MKLLKHTKYHFIFDWETLSSIPYTAPVLSLAIVVLDSDLEQIDQCYMGITTASCLEYTTEDYAVHTEIEESTLVWWNAPKQAEAYQYLDIPGNKPKDTHIHFDYFGDVEEVLQRCVEFLEFYSQKGAYTDDVTAWGRGPEFDAVIWEAWLTRVGSTNPIHFSKWRSLRNVDDILRSNGHKRAKPLIAHDALSDCYAEQTNLKVLKSLEQGFFAKLYSRFINKGKWQWKV